MKTFRNFVLIRDIFKEDVNEPKGNEEKGSAISAEQRYQLGKGDGPKPIVIGSGKDQHPNLAILVKAFNEPVEFGPQQIDKKGGVKKSSIRGKKIYLVGGAVRDFLIGKMPKDYDLATDATIDEIRLILTSYGFAETTPKAKMGGKEGYEVDHNKYVHLPKTSNNSYQFSVIGTDMNDQEMVIQAKINEQDFEIATFREDAKTDGRSTQIKLTSDIRKDAERRDLTMNALYIGPLKIGENKDVIDFYGGVQDTLGGKVRFVGEPKARLEEDQLRALRYLRFKSRFSDWDVSEKDLQAIQNIAGLPRLQPYKDDAGQFRDPRPRIRDEFLKGLTQAQDPAKFFELADKLGLLSTVFPNMNFKHGSSDKDKHLAIASLLADNDPQNMEKILREMHWTNSEINRIKYLIDLAKRFHPNMDAGEIYNFIDKLRGTGTGEGLFSTGYHRGTKMGPQEPAIYRWAKMQKRGNNWEQSIDALLHASSLERHNVDPFDPDWAEFIDPITGRIIPNPNIKNIKIQKERDRYLELMKERMPKNISSMTDD